MNKYLYPYNKGSRGAKALAEALGIKRIKRQNSKFRGSKNKLVINWGCSSLPEQVKVCNIINKPEAVNIAGCKLKTFQKLSENAIINIPEFTQDKEVVKQWLGEGCTIVARTELRGHSGQGIVIFDNIDDIVDAPLYVKYIKKTHEFRVHVFGNNVIDQQRKARKKDVPDDEVNWQVRNLAGGFIFMREGVDLPPEALAQAVEAVNTIGIDFAAVDIIYNQKKDEYYVLEINTAPGLSGTTLEKYKEAFDGV